MTRQTRFGMLITILAFTLLAALMQPCIARIVYTQTDQLIKNDGSLSIDFSNNGHTDVIINQSGAPIGNCSYDQVSANAASGGGILSGSSSPDGPLAAALSAGAPIGSQDPFVSSAIMVDLVPGIPCGSGHNYGYWLGQGAHYLGVAFVKNGKVHYGWALLQCWLVGYGHEAGAYTKLTGYAYQTIAGMQILAGKT